MTLVSFNQHANEIVIITDTITVKADGTPHHFASKAVPVPHLGVVIAGAGVHQILADWARVVLFDLHVADLDGLAACAEIALPDFAEKADPNPDEDRHGGHTVIYHFGWSETAGGYVRDVFDRADNFQQRRHTEPAFGIRPNPKDGLPILASLDEWVAFIKCIRGEWGGLPVAERIEIGGDLTLIQMKDHQITVRRLDRFEDRDEMHERIIARQRGGPPRAATARTAEGERTRTKLAP